MHLAPDPYAVSCPIDICIQVPVPKDTSLTEHVMSDTQIINYLKTPSLDIDSIPLGMYVCIQSLANKLPINEEFANVLLRVWGINSSILEEKEELIPILIRGICDTLNHVKEDFVKKTGESL